MNKKMAEALIENDCFERVMAAMRGPDKEDDAKLKVPFTSVLRWTVGFDYGTVERPRDVTLDWQVLGASHFEEHLYNAFSYLVSKLGWTISRVPLVAYVDPQAAKNEALGILGSASLYCSGEALSLLTSCHEKVLMSYPKTDPDFHLTLPLY